MGENVLKKNTEKTRMLIKKVISTGFGHIFGANVINQVIAFVSNFIVIRVLSKSDYGIYSYAFNIYSFLAMANGFGMEPACLQVCSEKMQTEKNADRYLKFGMLAGSGFNVFLGMLIVLGALYLPLPLEGVNDILILFAALPLLYTFFNFIQTYFRYNMMNVEFSKCSVINTALILVASVAGAYLLQASGTILFRELAYVLSILCAIWIYRFPIKRIFRAAAITLEEKKDILKLSVISMLNTATGQLYYLVDVFLVGWIITDETIVASYKTATIIPNALLFIPAALVVYIYPFFSQRQGDKQWVKQKYFLLLKYFSIVNALISACLIVFAPVIIKIVFGSQYLDAVPAFRILSLSYFFTATFRKITGNLLVTQRKLQFNVWLGLGESVLNIISNWVLIHLMGAVGAAVTTLIICIITSAISVAYFVRYLNKEETE